MTNYGTTVDHAVASHIGSGALFCSSKFGFRTSDIFILSPQSCSREFFADY